MSKRLPRSATRNTGAVSELIRFGLVGLLNTGTTLSIIWVLMLLGVGPYAANFCGYGVGIVISFILNRNWTFRRHEPTRSVEVFHFLLACGVAYLANLTVVAGLLRLAVQPYLAQLAAMPAYTVCFFLLSKYFVFSASKNELRSIETR